MEGRPIARRIPHGSVKPDRNVTQRNASPLWHTTTSSRVSVATSISFFRFFQPTDSRVWTPAPERRRQPRTGCFLFSYQSRTHEGVTVQGALFRHHHLPGSLSHHNEKYFFGGFFSHTRTPCFFSIDKAFLLYCIFNDRYDFTTIRATAKYPREIATYTLDTTIMQSMHALWAPLHLFPFSNFTPRKAALRLPLVVTSTCTIQDASWQEQSKHTIAMT